MRVPPEQAAEERRLLELGRTIKDVALQVGASPKRLEERNRLLYRIDLRAGFQRRIECDGVPPRLAIDASFGHWFAGLFDGEGHFVIDLRPLRKSSGRELQLGLNVYLRDDDAGVLQRVHDALGGRFRPTSKDNVAYWGLRGIATLAEVAVPLFERYPLHSKKAREFELFRNLVMQRYIATLGGKRRRAPLENVEEIEAAIAQLRARRRYADRSSWRVLEDAAGWGRLAPDRDDQTLAWARERLVPQPLRTFTEPLAFAADILETVPHTYVHCSLDGSKLPDSVTPERGWQLRTLEAGHWPMLSRPADLARVLRELIGGRHDSDASRPELTIRGRRGGLYVHHALGRGPRRDGEYPRLRHSC